jgi:hypothetical protein
MSAKKAGNKARHSQVHSGTNGSSARPAGRSTGRSATRQPRPWYQEAAKPNMRLINGAAVILVILAIFLLSMLAIQADRKREEDKKGAISFGIHLVRNMTGPQAAEMPLERLVLDSTPILSDEDIRLYQWSGHVLNLYDEQAFLDRLPSVPTHGLPFVVMVNGERIYLGAFWTSFSSLSTELPVIDVFLPPLAIKPGYPWDQVQDPDPRNDPRIRSVFKVLGKLG